MCVCVCACVAVDSDLSARRFTQINKLHDEAETKEGKKLNDQYISGEKSQHRCVLTKCEGTVQ